LLVNITNDAWFKDTKAPFLHLQSSVFRTIENRRGLVRAANTGVSSFVAPSGRITGGVEDENRKKTYVRGFAVETVILNDQETFYTKFGDVFLLVCLGCLVPFGVICLRSRIASRQERRQIRKRI
jgi:apolipoprotein N-acyltransferase